MMKKPSARYHIVIKFYHDSVEFSDSFPVLSTSHQSLMTAFSQVCLRKWLIKSKKSAFKSIFNKGQ